METLKKANEKIETIEGVNKDLANRMTKEEKVSGEMTGKTQALQDQINRIEKPREKEEGGQRSSVVKQPRKTHQQRQQQQHQ